MKLTASQIKGKIKNEALKKNVDPRVLLRIFMMERFLERLSKSQYRTNFIIKGGILVSQMISYSLRSTMDIDTSIKNINLDNDNIEKIFKNIISIDLDDGISFEIKNVENIMDSLDYPGIRVHLDSYIDKLVVPIKIDISTGDVITPNAIEYNFNLLLEDKSILLLTYNLETILAEKFQTIIVRDIANTRMRDFYDIYILLKLYRDKIDAKNLSKAYRSTSMQRNSERFFKKENEIIKSLKSNNDLKNLWNKYKEKYFYASNISFEETITSLKEINEIIQKG